jgi:SAM-dependent methyltransferase
MRQAAGEALRPGGLELTRRGLALAGLAPGCRVLDAGCGPGATLDFLVREGLRPCGLDLAPGRPGPSGPNRDAHPRVAGDIAALPFVRGVFGAVFCECVLSLLPDPVRAMGELVRVLAPGGALVVSDLFRPQGMPRAPAGESCAAEAFSFAEMLGMFRAAGLYPRAVENHTRRLKELAARLLFLGEPLDCPTCATGYYLLVARKTGDEPCSTTPASG